MTGKLNTDDRVFLVNPSGVLFVSNTQVNVSGPMASTQYLTGSWNTEWYGNRLHRSLRAHP
ncbi:filamentous hemagglutinin N-terminal domain-containing protein [Serratia sp. D1N4]